MEDDASLRTLLRELRDTYDTYVMYTFRPWRTEGPLRERWKENGERTAYVILGMCTIPVMLYRVRRFLLRRNVPLLPYLCHLLSMAIWRISIGPSVTIGPGLVVPHGQIVIDGTVDIGRSCTLNPWVTIGLRGSRRDGFDPRGPIIGDEVHIGTGAKVIGPVRIGDRARVGANAVVLHDVPAGATVVGAPARVVRDAPPFEPANGAPEG